MNQPQPESTESRDPNAWGACESGMLSGLARDRQAAVARSHQSMLAGGTLVAAAAVVVLAFMVTNRETVEEPEVWGIVCGGIACSECVEMMPAYNDHLVDDAPMAEEDVESMSIHLAECDKCQEHFESRFPGVLSATVAAGLAAFAVVRRRSLGTSR